MGLSTEEFNVQNNKHSVLCFEERARILRSLFLVNRVIPETAWEQKVEDV